MKSILISIKPKWVAKILNGEKTIEIRKTMPKCNLPIDVYIYCTKRGERLVKHRLVKGGIDYTLGKEFSYYDDDLNGKVVAKFTLDKVEEIRYFDELQIPDGYEDYDGNWVDTSTYAKDIHWISNGILKQSCLSYDEVHKYLGKKTGYAWHISNLEIFDKPKELLNFKIKDKEGSFEKPIKINAVKYLTKAPQSWCYVVEVE